MPVVASFDGIKIMVFANEHPPVHFHAQFGEHQALFSVEPLEMIEGFFPIAKKRRLLKWASTRKVELLRACLAAIALKKVEDVK